MQDFINKKILLGICGGIAAYKSAYLVRELIRLGAEVKVIMTAGAQEFITGLTFQALGAKDVRTELFDSEAEAAMGHIELARWADYLLVAPATANCLAKFAQGLANDLLSTVYLVNQAPVFLCPAMNKNMWAHPATQANCDKLIQRGVIIIGPAEGLQACGDLGLGRMSEVDTIIDSLRVWEVNSLLQGRQVMITAGPTREALDPVRYLSNHSSGKMGYALALAAHRAGADVSLITGPTQLVPPTGINVYSVESAKAMYDKVMEHFEPGMIFIGAAAVGDYHFGASGSEKIKKEAHAALNLSLNANKDIVAAVAARGDASLVVGFAAETHDLITHAKKKLQAKNLDMIVANQVGKGIGFDSDYNEVAVVTKERLIELPYCHKTRLAGQIIAIVAATLHNSPIQSRKD